MSLEWAHQLNFGAVRKAGTAAWGFEAAVPVIEQCASQFRAENL
jgi:hypothetical protein